MKPPSLRNLKVYFEDLPFRLPKGVNYFDSLPVAFWYGIKKVSVQAGTIVRRYKPLLRRWLVALLRWLTTPLFLIALSVWLLWPQPSRTIYAEPQSTAPAPQIVTVKAVEPLPESKLAEQAQVAPIAPPAPVYVAPAPVYVPYVGIYHSSDYRIEYIFQQESGGRLTAVNGGGCIGLGQDCNGWLVTGRLDSPACPDWRTNLNCQLRYWDWYAARIYGGWTQAYYFRTSHNYW